MKSVILGMTLSVLTLARADDLVSRVLILANSRQPGSVELAAFYAEQRGIPPANIIALSMPEDESITWRQFIDQVYQPLQDELYQRKWIEGTASSLLDRYSRKRYALVGHRLSYLVVCRGTPLRIYNDPTLLADSSGRKFPELLNKNEAAVDSELSLLAMSGYEINGYIGNPLFRAEGPLTLDAAQVIKVSRLDGPTWESARNLVRSAQRAEQVGLVGRYYIDVGGPDKEGDRWLESVHTQLHELGYEGELESSPATFDGAHEFKAPAFYFGWYASQLNGPMSREGFEFLPGAIAMHIHSFSAETLHSETLGWCGPLVVRGVAATAGNVFEPYLGYTHRPDVLVQALSRGMNFGDAIYHALPVLSWQAVAIGDPLYRPFLRSRNMSKEKPAAVPRVEEGK